MSETRNVLPTRQGLLRAARRLERVARGAALLRRKREALVNVLFSLARPAAETRRQIDEGARESYDLLLETLALHGEPALRALSWPLRDLDVDMEGGQVWGVPVATITRRPPIARSLVARGTAPGTTGPAAAATATSFEHLLELLLDAATREMLIRRLGEALARTSRQVHTLERRVAPALESQVAIVKRTLEEREREDHLRLKHLARLR